MEAIMATSKVRNVDEVLNGHGGTVEPSVAAKPSTQQASQCNGATWENSSMMTRLGTGGCRKGRKAVLPWRFQIGYKRPRSQGLSQDGGSDGLPATGTSMSTDGTGASKSMDGSRHIGVAAAASVPNKTKVDNGDRHRPMPKNRVAISRESVMASLQEFRLIYRQLVAQEKADCGKQEHDLAAFQVFRERLCVEFDDRRYLGSVPGVHVGDVFDSDAELFLVGLHRTQQSRVDYINQNGGRTCLAVSIVSYAQQSAQNNNLDFLLHVGSVAATTGQNMEGTDLALKQSMDTKTHVRVIYRFVMTGREELTYYVYGGLYLVEKFSKEKLREDKHISTFHLRRLSGQPSINIHELVEKRMDEPSNGTFTVDISSGLEKIPISAINSISNEAPAPFRYISHIQYLRKYQLDPPSGCDCVGRCSDSQKCACVMKNGGKIPFRKTGGLLEEKPLIYECGPSCKCPPTCRNRVGQHGISFRLQVFKTTSMGWGVRSLDFIPTGRFVCEYIGELLDNEDAQERGNDEYLFLIGNNYYDVSRWDNLQKTIPSLMNGPGEEEENFFAVDALKCGNLARFINHSCTPNLFTQNVLYDHDNKGMPHIMLFACEDIQPLEPLSYDYNYTIDGVHDSEGNIKKKRCLCGSVECTGWLY
ncbi:unnamed protein product [Triticum turgidum subsp. durum]|uniref:Histone-lysine N-methyltransferase n=1 Tax=Triticum turgidum subsp. durum TaxID=4567 RepID=A0A9R1R0G8_TRITD|nr:unnamed protein product [Triticum turgidum subsp. durum]